MGQLEDMAVFVKIVDAGGISKAADQLDIAKSAVSRRLSDLEGKYQTQLINRTTRNWSLTEAGQKYYDNATAILEEVDSLNDHMEEAHSELSGTLKLNAPMSFGLKFLEKIIAEFSELYPDLKIQVDFSDSQIDIVEEGYELAVRIAELEDSTLRAKRVAPIRHVFVASPKYLDKMGRPTSIKELQEHRFLKYNLSAKQSIKIESASSNKVETFSPVAHLSSNNSDFLKEMAIQHHGITYMPTFLAYDAIADGKLDIVLHDHKLPTLNLYLVYPNNRFVSARARTFIDFVSDHCGDAPYWDEDLNLPGALSHDG